MSTLGDRLVMTVIILGIALPLLGWVVGSYIEVLPGWYPAELLPAVALVFTVVLAVVAWKWLDRMD